MRYIFVSKLITVCMLIVFMSTVFQGMYLPVAGEKENGIFYYIDEDFAGESVLTKRSWSIARRNGTVVIESDDSIEDEDSDLAYVADGNYLKMVGNVAESTNTFPAVTAMFPYSVSGGKLAVETRVRADSSDSTCWISLRNTAQQALWGAVLRRRNEMTYNEYTVTSQWEVNRWYDIKIIVDFDAKKIDAYLDGELVVAGGNFQNEAVDSAALITFSASPAANVFGVDCEFDVNYLKVYNFEETMETEAENTIEPKYKEKIELLKVLNILNDDFMFERERYVTRGDFAQSLVLLYGDSGMQFYESEGNMFTDINSKNGIGWQVVSLCHLGVMVGYPDGTFLPEKEVLYEEALKAFIHVLNYQARAENSGGYPYGYLMVAGQIGLLKDVEALIGQPLTYGDFILLLCNALNIDLMQTKNLGTTNVSYAVQSGVSILTEYLHTETGTGIVTANSFTGLFRAADSSANSIEINKIRYNNFIERFDDYLGQNVKFYYSEVNGERTIRYIMPLKNDILTVTADEINKKRTTQNDGYFVYEANGKEFKISVDKAYVIYNGKAYDAALNMNLLCPESGKVVFIDNNNDGQYDVVSVTDYEIMIVRGFNAATGEVYGTYNETLALYDDYTLYRNGFQIEISDLKTRDVLSILQSKNIQGKILTQVYVSRKMISGTVAEVEADDGDGRTYVTIDKKKYGVSAVYEKYNVPIKVNLSAIFYLDIDDNIIGIDSGDTIDTVYKTGYILKVVTAKGLSGFCDIKMLDSSGKVLYLTGDSKIIVNGEKYMNGNALIEKLKETAVTVGETDQLVRYTLNANGKITTLETGYYRLDFPNTGRYYRANRLFQIGAEGFFLKNNAMVFKIPSLDSQDDDYTILPVSSLVEGTRYNVEAYNISEMGISDIIILRNTSQVTISSSAPLFVVEKISNALHPSGDIIKKLSGYVSDTYREVFMARDAVDADVPQKGDIIQYSTNLDGLIDHTDLVVALCGNTDPFVRNSYGSSEPHYVFGYLKAVNDSGIVVCTSLDPTAVKYPFLYTASTSFLLYDVARDRVEKIEKTELHSYVYARDNSVRIFVYSYFGGLRNVILVKG